MPSKPAIHRDYELSIEDVARRLNKSVRTIHRYKDSGKLSHVIGTSQGNPLMFSVAEVEALRQELYPHLAPAQLDPQFWTQIERVERVLGMLERNPWLEQLLQVAGEKPGSGSRAALQETLDQLARAEHGHEVDRKALGQVLIHLGNALLRP